MREKVLKQYTIVPANLYVERDADRQLKEILKDMQRPGYVLVSRQMGKTNLLLHTKQLLESAKDIFVYLDLSARAENERACFENIIDTAIATHEDLYSQAKLEIENSRAINKNSPQREHSDELRILLKYTPNKLVIILDEIDALTQTDYSDHIFSLIRSTYFSRVNFPVFEKLTYVLSGVIEPTEIIKDNKISPFNIGQKIFLNDFSYLEYQEFLKKAQLIDIFPIEVINKIYYWTHGNPRMVWDICYEIDNCGIKLDDIDVDQIITQMYLIAYDKPPIDNIRELVKKDRELRDAIMQIFYGKGTSLADRIKNKLYLTGITSLDGSTITIKNEIIAKAVCEDWLRQIDIEERGLFKVGVDYYDKHEYALAMDSFERYEITGNKIESSPLYYYMGWTAYQLHNYPKALEYINKTTFDKVNDRRLYYDALYLKGILLFYSHPQEAFPCFEEICNENVDKWSTLAQINMAVILLDSDDEIKQNEAVSILTKFADNSNDVIDNPTRTIAYYNIAGHYLKKDDISQAINNYTRACELADYNTKPVIWLSLYEIENKIEYAKDLITYLCSVKKLPKQSEYIQPMEFTTDSLLRFIVYTYINEYNIPQKHEDTISKLANSPCFEDVLYQAAFYAVLSLSKINDAITILNAIIGKYEIIDQDNTFLRTTKLLAFINPTADNLSRFLESRSNLKKYMVDYMDINICRSSLLHYLNSRNYQKAYEIFNWISKYESDIKNNSEFSKSYIFIKYMYAHIAYLSENKIESNKYAHMVETSIQQLSETEFVDIFGAQINRKTIENNLKVMQLSQLTTTSPYRAPIKYGRNDIISVQYENGIIKKAKYKKVEEDILAQKCKIIDNI